MRSLTTLFLVLSLSVWTVALAHDKSDPADEVRAVVEDSYINGAFNALDPDAMTRGFHPDFAIFSADGEKIKRYPIGECVSGTWQCIDPLGPEPLGWYCSGVLAATELCDTLDQNCNGTIHDGIPPQPCSATNGYGTCD